MVNLNEINKELKKVDPRLYIESIVEDYDGQDLVEYGIEDIEETRHYALFLDVSESCSIVMKDHFCFSEPRSLLIAARHHTIRFENEGFDTSKISRIESVLLSFRTNRIKRSRYII